MSISEDLLSQFAKITNDTSNAVTEKTVYATAVEYEGKMYARLDGSDRLTPMYSTVVVKAGDRVIVLVKNHKATITGNVSSPSARNDDLEATNEQVKSNSDKIGEFALVIANKVDVGELEAQIGRIDNLEAENVVITETLKVANASIEDLQADNVFVKDTLKAQKASIENLHADKLDVEVADAKYATVENLKATDADIHNLEVDYGDFKKLAATQADLEEIDAKKLDAEKAKIKYANIDFSNIGKAAIEHFYATSGIIKDLVIGDQTVTGELVGVTIKGDLIEGNTVVADKIVIKGEDGLYYKLNTDGMTTEAEQTDYNSLNGQILRAKSVTAEKISVKDLVAFDATIGGFNIGLHSLYSGVKESATNTTRGVFLGDDGELGVGDSKKYIKYYKDADGKYRLAISADSISLGTSEKNVEESIEDVKTDIDSIRDEITTLLCIESSRGNVFKNDNMATVLSVVIYHGSMRITDINMMKNTFGDSAYLQWEWQRITDNDFGIVPSDNGRIENDGFAFTILPEDVETKVVFMCKLIVP